MRRNAPVLLVALAFVFFATAPAGAAGISIESYSSMSVFQTSPLYTFIMGSPGGITMRQVRSVQALKQGTMDVPAASAGTPGNETVSSEILAAAIDVPDCFSLDPTPSFYDKRFVSLGRAGSGEVPPFLTLEIAPASSGEAGGYNGFDIVVFDLGKNLATGTGTQNREATVFQVELMSLGIVHDVGTIRSTAGNFLNAILLDISGIPGIPVTIDAIRISDVTTGNESGAIDVDGAVTLNLELSTPSATPSWGRLKSLYRH